MPATGHAYINNLSAFLPGPPVSNDEMEAILGMVGDKPSRARRVVLRSNGIVSRHYVIDRATGEPTHTNAALAAEAIRRLQNESFSLEQMDLLACGTAVADQLMPNHASMVHGELGTRPCEAIATAGVCLAGISALKYAFMGVKSGEFKHAVASASELSSSMMRARCFGSEIESRVADLEDRPEIAFEKDFLRWMLSDGAGAMLIEPAPSARGLSLRIDWIFERSYAGETDACMYAGAEKRDDGTLRGWLDHSPQEWLGHSIFAVKQDVKQLNENVIHYTVERTLQAVQQCKGLKADDVDWYVPHYSSTYFRERVYAGMKAVGFEIPYERWFTNLTTKGNTGAAAIYIMLDELFHSGRITPGQRVLCYIPESGRMSSAFMHLTACDATGG